MPPLDAEGALDAEPAAGELRALLERLRGVDPGHARDRAREITTAGAGARSAGDALARQAGAVESGWQGEGALAFAAYARAFGQAGVRTEDRSRAMAATLEEVATTLEGLRTEVNTQVEAAVSAAASARASAPPDLPELPLPSRPSVADTRAADALAAPTAAARAALARAEDTLRELADRLTGATRATTAFGALPTVGAQTAPAGAPLPWRPRPVDPPLRPTPADPARPPTSSTPEPRAATGGGHGGGSDGGDSDGGADLPGDGDLVGPAPSSPAPSGEVGGWIAEAMRILAANGTDPSLMNADDIALIIDHESGGDPGAVNGFDANAARGAPSQGLMQTIPSTFRAFGLPGHGDITDPVDNIIAGVRYAIERYGSTARVPGVASIARGGQYLPY